MEKLYGKTNINIFLDKFSSNEKNTINAVVLIL